MTSIVIVTLNNLALTQRCLHSIRLYTDAPYEIIAVDNGSTDGTVAWLSGQTDIRLIANGDNRGFAAACNQGAAVAAGEQILLLNNDTVVSWRWLSQLLAAMRDDDRVGIVGPKSNQVLRMQLVEAAFPSEDDIHRFSESFNRRQPSKWQEACAISGFCMLVRRTVWNSLGGLDEAYGIGGFEDIDFGYQALKAGFALRIAGDTFVYHEGSRSFAANALDIHAIGGVNRRLFLRKWGFNPERLFFAELPFLPGRHAHAHPHHMPAAQEIPNGWYARVQNGGVYRIENGSKRPVASLDTLLRLKVPPERIASVPLSSLRHLPDGVPLNANVFPHGYPDVYLARDPAGGMHLISRGIRYPIGSEAAFSALGYRWDEAVSLTYPQIVSIVLGWPVTGNVWEEHELIDYRLYRGPDGGLYYGEGQRLRAVPDEGALRRYGLGALDAVPLPAELFCRIPRGFGLP
nr:glycosyltransferase family 2 protein [Cohnella sp. CFH 77786]